MSSQPEQNTRALPIYHNSLLHSNQAKQLSDMTYSSGPGWFEQDEDINPQSINGTNRKAPPKSAESPRETIVVEALSVPSATQAHTSKQVTGTARVSQWLESSAVTTRSASNSRSQAATTWSLHQNATAGNPTPVTEEPAFGPLTKENDPNGFYTAAKRGREFSAHLVPLAPQAPMFLDKLDNHRKDRAPVTQVSNTPGKRSRGRPKGSKNKPKTGPKVARKTVADGDYQQFNVPPIRRTPIRDIRLKSRRDTFRTQMQRSMSSVDIRSPSFDRNLPQSLLDRQGGSAQTRVQGIKRDSYAADVRSEDALGPPKRARYERDDTPDSTLFALNSDPEDASGRESVTSDTHLFENQPEMLRQEIPYQSHHIRNHDWSGHSDGEIDYNENAESDKTSSPDRGFLRMPVGDPVGVNLELSANRRIMEMPNHMSHGGNLELCGYTGSGNRSNSPVSNVTCGQSTSRAGPDSFLVTPSDFTREARGGGPANGVVYIPRGTRQHHGEVTNHRINNRPTLVSKSNVPPSTLLARGLDAVINSPAAAISPRGTGQTDPENIWIVELYEHGARTFPEIVQILNERRVDLGKKADVSVCAVTSRYARTAPGMFESLGQEWIPIGKREKNRKHGLLGSGSAAKASRKVAWDENMTYALVKVTRDVDSERWHRVARKLNERLGRSGADRLTADQCARRHVQARTLPIGGR